jgi:holin-like protein
MMTLICQFGRILLICLLAEALSALLPRPIPSSVYGLLLMLAALGLKLLKVDQVKQASSFLVGILPILFLVPAVGIMSLWAELRAFLLPCVLAAVPVTVLVMAVSGLVTQWVQGLGKKGSEGGDGNG